MCHSVVYREVPVGGRFVVPRRRQTATEAHAMAFGAAASDGSVRGRLYAIAAMTCAFTIEWTDDHYVSEARGYINNASVNREGMIQTSSVSSVSDAGSWPRSSSSWTRSCVRPRSCIASGFSTSSSSSSRWLGDRRILPPPSSSLSE